MSGQPHGLLPYPFDFSPVLAISTRVLNGKGIHPDGPGNQLPNFHQPTIVAREALIEWNRYLTTGDEQHRAAFLANAAWLLGHATAFTDDVSGWPVLTQLPLSPEPVPLLSASTQGLVLSVLVRAYRLTNSEVFWLLAQRAARAFERDIFDGGVSAPAGDAGIFFEEVAAYPAAHHLGACMIALCGLYDYGAVAEDPRFTELVQRCLSTLSTLVAAYDTGYWSRIDLASRQLADPATHELHIAFLNVLARASGDVAWAALAARWAGYQHSLRSRMYYSVAGKASRLQKACWSWLQRRFFRGAQGAGPGSTRKVCMPITAFPVAGGMRSVLAGLAQTMAGYWEMEYLTWHVGPHDGDLTIRSFGNSNTSYWQFPNVWFYFFSGWSRLLSLLRHGKRYHLIVPQDGLFTGAFAALAARLAGVRVVCMDHGHIPLPYSRAYRVERLKEFEAAPWLIRILGQLRYACYWPSLRLLARIATHAADSFLLAGDDVEMAYRQRLSVSSDRIIRFPYLIDTERYAPRDGMARTQLRTQLQLASDGIIIAMINRLAPEKGIDIALQGISSALQRIPAELASRVRVVIAGDGPLRSQVEEDIRRYHLESTCLLWGEVTPDDVARLLSISDLFLFTAVRDSNSVAVLEAMAAGLMVIASLVPPSKATLLGEGRGLGIPAGNVEAVSAALAEAICDPLRCRQMGTLARTYIDAHHSAEVIRRCLFRATGWPLAVGDVNWISGKDDLIVAEQRMS